MKDFNLSGPTLDVASGECVFFPVLKKYRPELLPYSVSELNPNQLSCEEMPIQSYKFHCEKDRLELPDRSVGTILFCDIIEHLIIDPVWSILEFNRILKDDGHLIISTPNASYIKRVFQILRGYNSATECHIKPTSIYQRHNREWTINELNTLMRICGFDSIEFSTHSFLLDELDKDFLKFAREYKVTELKDLEFGPEIFIIGKKCAHKTLDSDLTKDERWPVWLYTHYDNYRRRPEIFPIIIGKDYG